VPPTAASIGNEKVGMGERQPAAGVIWSR